MTFLVILIFIVGIVAGALIAHIAEAMMLQRSLRAPDCPYCKENYSLLQWSATLALLSGRWRCVQCHQALRMPRLVGEIFVASVWAALVYRYGLNPRVLFSMLAVIPLAMIMVTDMEAKRVPNVIILPSIVLMLVLGALLGPALPMLKTWSWTESLIGAAVGFGVLRILVWVGVAVFGEGAMGEGDITLATYVGALVGFPLVIEALLLAFTFGGIGALLVLLTRRGTLQTAIPYGPYIILGAAVVLLWGLEILRWFLA